MRKQINAVSEGKVTISSDKEYERAVKFFKNVKKGDKIKLAKDLYYGAMGNLTIKDATSKYGFKVGNDYGDGTGEYIIPKGTVLVIDKVYGNGTAPSFTYKGLTVEFTNIDDVTFEADIKSLNIKTSYFNFSLEGDEVTMTDLNGNVTTLYAEDITELANAFKKLGTALK